MAIANRSIVWSIVYDVKIYLYDNDNDYDDYDDDDNDDLLLSGYLFACLFVGFCDIYTIFTCINRM